MGILLTKRCTEWSSCLYSEGSLRASDDEWQLFPDAFSQCRLSCAVIPTAERESQHPETVKSWTNRSIKQPVLSSCSLETITPDSWRVSIYGQISFLAAPPQSHCRSWTRYQWIVNMALFWRLLRKLNHDLHIKCFSPAVLLLRYRERNQSTREQDYVQECKKSPVRSIFPKPWLQFHSMATVTVFSLKCLNVWTTPHNGWQG